MIRKLVALLSLVGGLVAEERPNLLFITVDDMNCDSVGAFGCEVKGITPHIDKLASQGMCFDRGFVTIAICQPTRAVWMTGLYPHRNGALGFDPIAKDVPSLPEKLKKGGYYFVSHAPPRAVYHPGPCRWHPSGRAPGGCAN